MSTNFESLSEEAALQLSALVDGELSPPDVGPACQRWRSDSQARATWHAYQLIGDVLRSDDLASAPGHDRDFLARFRERLVQEPVVLAPLPDKPLATAQPMTTVRRPLRASMAIAAGFAVVAGALVVIQLPLSSSENGSAVAAVGQGRGVQTVAVASKVVGGSPRGGTERKLAVGEVATVLDGQVIRDARLDEYLGAHKKFGGSSAPGGPSGFLRNATAEGR